MAEDGRGLEIVAVVADRWGQCGNEYGRSVYFELRWNPQDRPRTARSTTAGRGACPGRSSGSA